MESPAPLHVQYRKLGSVYLADGGVRKCRAGSQYERIYGWGAATTTAATTAARVGVKLWSETDIVIYSLWPDFAKSLLVFSGTHTRVRAKLESVSVCGSGCRILLPYAHTRIHTHAQRERERGSWYVCGYYASGDHAGSFCKESGPKYGEGK